MGAKPSQEKLPFISYRTAKVQMGRYGRTYGRLSKPDLERLIFEFETRPFRERQARTRVEPEQEQQTWRLDVHSTSTMARPTFLDNYRDHMILMIDSYQATLDTCSRNRGGSSGAATS